jgi:hypothetical protein
LQVVVAELADKRVNMGVAAVELVEFSLEL